MIALLVLALAQAGDLEALVGKLAHDDPAVREKAQKELVERGPGIVPRILSLHRSTDSSELRLRAERILESFPFPAYAQTRPGEPLQVKLRELILDVAEIHRPLPECWKEEKDRTTIDPARLRVMLQGGSGHGQKLHLDELTARKEGGAVVRRIAFEGPTAQRPDRKERTWTEETVLDEGETRALAALLEAGAALRQLCAEKKDEAREFWSSTNFSLRFEIESAGKPVWSCAYTGYRNSSDQRTYAHGLILERILLSAVTHRTWSPAEFTAEDRRRLLRWMEENFEREAWWVREFYLRMSVTSGDDTYLPFLRLVRKDLRGKEGPSEMRQILSVKEALRRISGSED